MMLDYIKILALVPLVQLMVHMATAGDITGLDPQNANSSKRCMRQIDFSIVVDESASIKDDDWKTKMIPFLENLINAIDLDGSDIKLSLTTFSTPVRSIFTFLDKEATNTEMAIQKLHQMRDTKPGHGLTYTGQALTFVRKSILPYGRKNVPKALLLITDGDSSDPDLTAQAAAMLRDEGVNVMVIGVGHINVSECRGIVGCDGVMDCPMFKHTNWGEMINLFAGFMKEVCDILPEDAKCQPVWTEWSYCNAPCNTQGSRTRSLGRLDTLEKETIGTNGQRGRKCEEQIENYPDETEPCTEKCIEHQGMNYDTIPIIGGDTSGDDSTVATNTSGYATEGSGSTQNDGLSMHTRRGDLSPEDNPTDDYDLHTPMSTVQPHVPGGSANPIEGTGGDADELMPLDPSSGNTPGPENVDYGRGGNETNYSYEGSGSAGDVEHSTVADRAAKYDKTAGELSDQAEIRRHLELKREEDLKRELEQQHQRDIEGEKHMRDLGDLGYSEDHHEGSAEGITGIMEGDDVHENASGHRLENTERKLQEELSVAENHIDSDEGQEESSTRSSSNTTKIAGGALLGLLLLGGGGGYAMYKKSKLPNINTDEVDYTGADESAQPLRDAETYTVTEFDNNIWGEAS